MAPINRALGRVRLTRHHTEYGQSGRRVQKKKPRRSGAGGAKKERSPKALSQAFFLLSGGGGDNTVLCWSVLYLIFNHWRRK